MAEDNRQEVDVVLIERETGEPVEAVDSEVFNPHLTQITGRYSTDESFEDPRLFAKTDLAFCSGEPLPMCWRDPRFLPRMDEITGIRSRR